MSPDELEEVLPWITGWGALVLPGSGGDDKSSFIMTPGRAWLTRFRTQESLIGKKKIRSPDLSPRRSNAFSTQANLTRFTPGFDRPS